MFLSSYTNGDMGVPDLLSILWQPIAQFWYLYALFLAFLISCVVASFVSKKFIPIVFLVAAIAYVFQDMIVKNTILGFVTNNYVFFMFGVCFASYNVKIPHTSRSIVFGVLFFILLQYVFHITLGMSYLDTGLLSLLLAMVSILFIVSLAVYLAKFPKDWLVFLGKSSMGIYLMHILAGSSFRILLVKLFGVQVLWMHLLMGSAFALLAPLFAVYVIGRLNIPFLFSAPLSKLMLTLFKVFK